MVRRLTKIVIIVSALCGICFAADPNEYITPENISSWKQTSERIISNPANIDDRTLDKLLYQARYPDNRISPEDKAYLKDFKKRATKVAVNLGHKYYASGDYVTAQKFYTKAETYESYIEQGDFVKLMLNTADMKIKQNKKGAAFDIEDAIEKTPDNTVISAFIDNNLGAFSCNELASIANRYLTNEQYANAVKYYTKAKEAAPDEVYKSKMENNIALCKSKLNKDATGSYLPQTNVAVSQDSVRKAADLIKTAVKKYNYGDYSGAMQDIEESHRLNPNTNTYYVLYPIVAASQNNISAAIKGMEMVISQEMGPFRRGTANLHAAYEFRGSLKLLQNNTVGAIDDFQSAFKSGFRDFDAAYKGLIISNLVSGDIQNAKTFINKYNNNNPYEKFADCTTYPDKIVLNYVYNQPVIYNSSMNNDLKVYIYKNALSDYAYIISNLYSDVFGDNYINIK